MREQSPEPQLSPREDGRPNPEELLCRYRLRDSDMGIPSATTSATGEQAGPDIEGYPRQRGRLRVYLASVAGAGKTYAMLNENSRAAVFLGERQTYIMATLWI